MVDNDGNVGIGTASPEQNLEITGSSYPFVLFSNNTSGRSLYVGGGSQVQLNTSEATIGVTIGNLHLDSENTSKIYFQYYAQTDSIFNVNGGNVGIGTASPGAELDVDGDILIEMMKYTGDQEDATLDTALASMYCASLVSPGYTQVVKQTTSGSSCTTTCAADDTYTTCAGGFFWNPRDNDARVYSALCAYTSYQKYCCCKA